MTARVAVREKRVTIDPLASADRAKRPDTLAFGHRSNRRADRGFAGVKSV